MVEKFAIMKICCTFAHRKDETIHQKQLGAFSSAGSEHLPYKQRVGGFESVNAHTIKGAVQEIGLLLFLYRL